MQRAGQTVKRFEDDTNSSTSQINNTLGRLRNSVLAIGTAFAAIRFGRSIIDAGVQVEALRNRMLAATGDANVAAASLAYVREEANRLGLDIRAATDGFSGFAASALRSGLTFEQTKDIFTGVSEAATSMRLSAEQTGLVFKALEQIAGKGTVSMEELRGQLGDALPGAFEIAAKAMGKSTAEFAKMVANGEVMSSEFLPKFGAAVRKELGGSVEEASRGAQAAFNRLGNAFFDLQTKLASSGLLDTVVRAVQSLTTALNDPQLVSGLSTLISLLAKAMEIALRAAAAIGSAVSTISDAIKSAGDAVFGLFNGGSEAIAKARGQGQPVKIDVAPTVDPNFTLGTATTPGPSAAQQKAAEKAARLRDQLAGQIDGLKRQFANPEDKALVDIQEQEKLLKQALDARAITEQEYRDLSLQAEVAYQEKLKEIRQQAWEEDQSAFEGFLGIRFRTQQQINEDSVADQGKNFRDTISQAAQHNRTFFAIEKAAALARAVIAARESVVSAYAFGSRIGGPFLGAAFAGVAAAAQAANIAGIASASFGGGSSGVSSAEGAGGSSGGSASLPEASGSAVLKNVYINLHGDDTLYSKNSVRKLIEGINDAIGDGSRLQIAVA